MNNEIEPTTLHIDTLRSECGYSNPEIEINNGYGCDHSECEERYSEEKQGLCYPWSCPIAYEANQDDLSKEGYDSSTSGYVVQYRESEPPATSEKKSKEK